MHFSAMYKLRLRWYLMAFHRLGRVKQGRGV